MRLVKTEVSMGWFHLTQVLSQPERVRVSCVDEPFFLGPGSATVGSEGFEELCKGLRINELEVSQH